MGAPSRRRGGHARPERPVRLRLERRAAQRDPPAQHHHRGAQPGRRTERLRRDALPDCPDGRFPSASADSAHASRSAATSCLRPGWPTASSARPARADQRRPRPRWGASARGQGPNGLVTCVMDGFIDSPQALAVSPDGRFLYAGADGDGADRSSIGKGGILLPLAGFKGCYRPVDSLSAVRRLGSAANIADIGCRRRTSLSAANESATRWSPRARRHDGRAHADQRPGGLLTASQQQHQRSDETLHAGARDERPRQRQGVPGRHFVTLGT